MTAERTEPPNTKRPHGPGRPAPDVARNVRRQEGPRRVRNGIRLSSKEGPVDRHWIATRWLKLLGRRVGRDALDAGLTYARMGQVRRLSISPGRVEGAVQGTVPKAYVATISVPLLEDAAWGAIVAMMATEAGHAAKLLTGEVTPAIDDVFRATGSQVIAPSADALEFSCTCGDAEPCKHVATIAYIAADRFGTDPTLAFDLAGLSADRVLERVRQARDRETRGVVSAHADPFAATTEHEAPPLESCLSDFWGSPTQLHKIHDLAPAEHAPHALLRRLGPSPLGGRFPLVGLLASIYDTVREEAVDLRDGNGGPESDAGE